MRHFLDLSSWTTKELWHLIQLSKHLKTEWQAGGNRPVLQGKILALIFQKPSLRTRVSFEVAMQHLGGHAVVVGSEEAQLGKRESYADVGRVLSGYVQGIVARVFDHAHIEELAANSTIPIINGLSDAQHPCQALADVLTIYEHFGRTNGLKLAYVGDGNNVAASLLAAAAHFGMRFSVATPPQYELPAKAFVDVAGLARESGAIIESHHDPKMAVQHADIIYTDTWVSMGQESEAEQRLPVLRPFQVNRALLENANKDTIVMHCLPAHRGDEITPDVADGPRSVIFTQAENRLHIQKAILVKLLA